MASAEILLTAQEIKGILDVSRRSPCLRQAGVFSLTVNRLDIKDVTSRNGVIIIHGDEHTGFQHVKNRHDFWSSQNFWKSVDGEIKLENPSLFSPDSLPIFEYSVIADQLYVPNNLNTTKNKRPELFDLYSGTVNVGNDGPRKYRLITYKGTPILHTLFPEARTNNFTSEIYNVVPYRKGNMQMVFNDRLNIVAFGLPFYNIEGNPVYSFQIQRLIDKGLEFGIFEDVESKVKMKLYQRPLPENYVLDIDGIQNEMQKMYFSNLTDLEKIIKKYEDSKKPATEVHK